jgi:threonine aldolase
VVRETDGLIDLRSDTVTKPTPEMRRAMAEAEVGDDVLGDDPTVRQLEELAAARVGKEAALFVPSGIMANLVSLLTLTGRHDEVIVGDQSHIYTSEVGGLSLLGSVFLHVLPNQPDGTIPLERLRGAIRNQVYTPRTRVISLESTHNRCSGAALPLDYIHAVAAGCEGEWGRAALGRRAPLQRGVALGVPAEEIAKPFEVVNFCFSKGWARLWGLLCAGRAAFIQEAKRTRRMLGGGMRQAGVLAAHALVALNDDGGSPRRRPRARTPAGRRVSRHIARSDRPCSRADEYCDFRRRPHHWLGQRTPAASPRGARGTPLAVGRAPARRDALRNHAHPEDCHFEQV